MSEVQQTVAKQRGGRLRGAEKWGFTSAEPRRWTRSECQNTHMPPHTHTHTQTQHLPSAWFAHSSFKQLAGSLGLCCFLNLQLQTKRRRFCKSKPFQMTQLLYRASVWEDVLLFSFTNALRLCERNHPSTGAPKWRNLSSTASWLGALQYSIV